MKKIIIIALMCLVSFTAFASDRIVPASALPANVTSFLSTHFSGVPVLFVEEDWDEYEVHLNNGFEVVFAKSGDWKEVGGCYQAVPIAIIPPAIATAVETMYAGAYIIAIEKDWTGFDVELSNRLELKMDANGQVYEIDYDD